MNPRRLFQPAGLLLVLSLLLGPLTANSQEWAARLSLPAGSQAQTVAIDANETITFIAGSILGRQGNWDIVLAAIERGGDTLWVHQWDMGADERAAALLADHDGGVVLALTRWDEAGPTAYLSRWSGSGNASWFRAFPDGPNQTSAVAIDQLASGAFVLAFASEGRRGSRCGLSSIASNGAEHWTVFTPNVHPRCLATSVDAIAVGGWNPDLPQQAPLLLYDTDGTLKARDDYSGAGNGRTLPVWLRHGSDGFYLAGHAIGEDGSGVPFVLHYSDGGSRRWTVHPITSTGRHRMVDLQPFPGGGIALTARRETVAGNHDIHLARLTSDGASVWEQHFDRTGGSRDRHPPLFGGVLSATPHGDSASVYWDHGRDDVTCNDDLVYCLYLATTSGGQDFSAPTFKITGATNLKLGNIQPGSRAFIVVRAADEAGNQDKNVREVVVTNSAPLPFIEAISRFLPDSLTVNKSISSACGEPLFSGLSHALICGGNYSSSSIIPECCLAWRRWSAMQVVRKSK